MIKIFVIVPGRAAQEFPTIAAAAQYIQTSALNDSAEIAAIWEPAVIRAQLEPLRDVALSNRLIDECDNALERDAVCAAESEEFNRTWSSAHVARKCGLVFDAYEQVEHESHLNGARA